MGHLTNKSLRRDLFPPSAFSERIVLADAHPQTYQEFISAEQESDDSSADEHGARVRLLQKGKTKRVDGFIGVMV